VQPDSEPRANVIFFKQTRSGPRANAGSEPGGRSDVRLRSVGIVRSALIVSPCNMLIYGGFFFLDLTMQDATIVPHFGYLSMASVKEQVIYYHDYQ
jgi:hypothetical protein